MESLLLNILPIKKLQGMHDDMYLAIEALPDGIQLDYGSMYQAPPFGFQSLKKLSELFGTDDLIVNNENDPGCESCDWGSRYSNIIAIRNITKNFEEIKALVGRKFGG